MKKRAAILLAIIAGFFVTLVAMPEVGEMRPSRLAKQLPDNFGNWKGVSEEPGVREKKILARDTEFERMNYTHREGLLPSVRASVVFSGKNLSQSIHRPEVCLRAQGWIFVKEQHIMFEDVLPGGGALPVKELICKRPAMKLDAKGLPQPILLENGEVAHIWTAYYYTFFGHEKVTSGHYQRTIIDVKDRLFHGYDQRWAYATFASFITKKHADQGIHGGTVKILDEKATKEHVRTFLKELLPIVVSEPRQGTDSSLKNGKLLGS